MRLWKDDSGDEEKRGLVCKVYCALEKPSRIMLADIKYWITCTAKVDAYVVD